MVARYFQSFPNIKWNGYDCIDITRREKIINSVESNPYVFYPIDLKEGQRPDVIANKYYKDSYYSWLVWLANKTIDPVAGWYMDTTDFYNFINLNYGSLPYTQRKILKWRTNWDADFSNIPPSMWDALGVNQKAYWTPQYDVNFNVTSYVRSNTNIEYNTNMIVSLTPDPTLNPEPLPEVGDLVSFVLANNIMGTAEVITSNTSNIVVNNVLGYNSRLVQYSTQTSNSFTVNDTVLISNTTSQGTGSIVLANSIAIIISYQGNLINGNTITILDQTTGKSATSSNCQSVQLRTDFSANTNIGTTINFSYSTVLAETIPSDQAVYYEPEYLFDHLDERNANNQTVQLLDSGFAYEAFNNLKSQIGK